MSTVVQEGLARLIEIAEEQKVDRRLGFIYGGIPANNCQRCTDCCFASTELYLVEFVNIYRYILTLPEEVRQGIARRAALYELLHLVTLEYKCPLIEDKACVVYPARPLASRLFGVYPIEDYDDMRRKSLQENTQLAMFFARNHRMLLPREVMTYDIEQCENNIDKNGKATVVSDLEREKLHGQLQSLNHEIINEYGDEFLSSGEEELTHGRFSYLFCRLFMSDLPLEHFKLEAMKEYLAGRGTATVDKLISKYGLAF